VDSGKIVPGVNYSTCKESCTNPVVQPSSTSSYSGAGTTGFVQLVHVATRNSAWAQLEEVITH